MKLLRAVVMLVVPLIACEPAPSPPAERVDEPTTGAPTERDLSFPGGGRILFLRARGPEYDSGAIGLVEADGTVRGYPRHNAFPYWDPVAADRLLLLPGGPPTRTISSEIEGDELRRLNSWHSSELPVYPSLDGRSIAFTPVDRSGRPRRRVLRLVDRTTGITRTVPSSGLAPLTWTPGHELLAAPWRGGHIVRWDPLTGASSPFGPGDLSDVVWDADGRTFASAIGGRVGGADGVVVIGEASGKVITRVPVGRRWVETPTWSPDGMRIAFIVRGPGPRGHRRASLHVYDLATRTDSVVANPVSDAFWAAWSPDGRWLLLDDWTRDRWLFVAADGHTRLPYPWLGHFPRWCCPSSPPVSVQIPVS
jgi:hypothetical protein